ncbi:MAG: mobile mystery protein B [Burkholderiales bacterium]
MPARATPLDPDEAFGLIPSHIRTQGELNEWEQLNVLNGQAWAFSRPDREDLLEEGFVRALHAEMFGETWAWAGSFRTEKNIGVDPAQIGVKLRDLLGDARYWLQHRTYALDEACVRFHHRLVSIHLFPNGNGRHARMLADVIVHRNGGAPFSWGSADLVRPGQARRQYIEALQRADQGDIAPLLRFARS